MAQKIEKNISWFLVLSLVMLSLGWFILEPTIAVNNVVDVTATVESMISCTTPAGTTNFADPLNDANIRTSTPNATTTVSSNGTVYVKIKDAGNTATPGLYCTLCSGTAAEKTIGSADSAYADTATLAVNVEGYGIQATTTDSILIATRYLKTVNDVGGFEITDQTLASSSASVSGNIITIIHKAAVNAANQVGNYADTITFTCSAS